ncbi:hypothetical protein [Pararhizobium mangrovi]|uniref:Uncharacterized protein n=1 Tax=Pararhizobium mangrovi TaxID=2590452 RepID=A0A506U298_9HYPH|nr:hypothetical protein [Pararhizobium mangrovi]TPW25997.1 hypothetical protein FJU11_16805 [Pararhizobium mangrovi]
MTVSTEAAAAGVAAKPDPALILLGRDEKGKAHASWFATGEAALARQAAKTMGMAAMPIANEEVRDIAGGLPQGKLFASGRAFVPFVKGTTYDALAKHLPAGSEPVAKKKAAASAGASAVGSAGGNRSGGTGAGSGHSAPPRPDDWSKLKPGHGVLASLDPDDGWWPAVVREDKGDGLFVLAWAEWPEWDLFLRRREQIALVHPKFVGQPSTEAEE